MTLLGENLGYYEQHYERLRQEALSPCRGLERGHSLALFLSRGMIAWMQALRTLQPPQPSSEKAVPGPLSGTVKLSKPVRSELTAVLAGMVLACRMRSSHE